MILPILSRPTRYRAVVLGLLAVTLTVLSGWGSAPARASAFVPGQDAS
jgi:hypothetical protein